MSSEERNDRVILSIYATIKAKNNQIKFRNQIISSTAEAHSLKMSEITELSGQYHNLTSQNEAEISKNGWLFKMRLFCHDPYITATHQKENMTNESHAENDSIHDFLSHPQVEKFHANENWDRWCPKPD